MRRPLNVVVVFSVLCWVQLTVYWLPTSCLWLVAELWTSKQLEVKVTESCQMFWRHWVARRGRLGNIRLPETMTFHWTRASDEKWFSKLEIAEICPCAKNSVWGKWQEVCFLRGGRREGIVEMQRRGRELAKGRQGSSQEVSQSVWNRVERVSQVSTCLMT